MDITSTSLLLFLKIFLISCTSRGDSDLKEELGECESGWEYFNGTCYLDSSSSALLEKAREKNFLDSQSECLLKNSVLLSLNPEEEGVFLQYLLDFKFNQKNIFKLQRYWLRNEHEEQRIKKESGENCSTFSIDLKSLKYYKSNAENCLMKHNYICIKRREESSNNIQSDCYFCNKRKKRSTTGNMNHDIKIVHHHPSWNSPFRSSYNSPFWDDFAKSHPYPRYLYHDPLNVMTLHNVRKRLQIELSKRKSPLLPLLQSTAKIPSSRNRYFIDTPELKDVGKPKLRNHLPIRVLDIMKYAKKDKEKKPPLFIGCRDDDILINETCFHPIKLESMKVAQKICKRDYNGILDYKTSDPFRLMDLSRVFSDNNETFLRFYGMDDCDVNPNCGKNPFPRMCEYEKLEPTLPPPIETGPCSYGYSLKEDLCYKLVTQNKTWNEAKAFCFKENATILNNVGIYNRTFLDFILNSNETEYSNTTFEYSKLWVNFHKDIESCLAIHPTIFKKRTRYIHCSEQHFFICQKPKKIKYEDFFDIRGKLKLPLTESVNNQSVKAHSTTIKAPTEGICPEESPEVWLRFGDYCYKFYSFLKKRPISWPESQHICEQKNAFLASIHSKEENQWIHSKINSFDDNFLWIGGKYDGNSKFLWDDGTSFDYIHWAKGEPNNLNEMEECVSIRTHDEIGEWNDDHCYEKAGYICKKLHSEIMTSVKPVNATQPSTTKLATSTVNVKTIKVKNTESTTTSPKSMKLTTSSKLATKTTAAAATTTATTTTTTAAAKKSTSVTTATSSTKTTNTATSSFTTPYLSKKTSLLPLRVTSKSSENKNSKIIFPSEMMTPKGHEKLAGGCPEDWYRMDNKCVKFYDMILMTYFEARDYCSSLDGKATLVSIHSEKQLAFIFALMTSYRDTWIGLRYSLLKEDFIWDDMSTVDYVHWAEYEPTMSSLAIRDIWSNDQGCVQVIVNGEEVGFWRDTDCYRQARAFVCQRPLDSKYERTPFPFPKKCSAPHDDYFSFGDNCYKYISTPLNWQNAEDTCAEEGGHLVTIRNRKEMSYIWNQFSVMSNSSKVWIGLKSSFFLIGHSQWSSGWPLFYTNWNSFRLYYRDSTSMSLSSGKWIPQKSYYELPFVCEYSKQTLTDTDSSNAKHCPKLGIWIDFPGDFCYMFDSSKSLSWFEASHYCTKREGHLVSINSEEEQKNIQYIVGGIEKFVWIGALRLHDLTYGWIDSSKFEFVNWFTNEPRNLYNPEDECIEMVSLGGFWKVNGCSRKKLFICKTSKIVSDPQNDELVAMDNSTVVDLKEPLDETSERGIGGVAIGGILVLILFVIGSGFLAGYFLMKKRQVQNAQPITFYGFDNVIYNAETITVAGQQIVCAPEERECILDDHEEVEDPKFSLTKS